MDRRRFRIYLYGDDFIRQAFQKFVREEAVVTQLFLDSTPMKVFTSGRPNSAEVYGILLVATSASGEVRTLPPRLAMPASTKASGVLSAVQLSSLFIDDLMHGGGFRMLFINCDGVNTNRKAVKVMISELQRYPDLLIQLNVCAAHGINNAVRWSLGVFDYGNILRFSHVLQSIKNHGYATLVGRMLKYEPPSDPVLETNTALEYYNAIQGAYCATSGDEIFGTAQPIEDLNAKISQGPSETAIIWKRLVRLIYGQKGPFSRAGPQRVPEEIADRCMKLFPAGPPMDGDTWYCVPGYAAADYVTLVEDLFGKAIPIPVASRWYDRGICQHP